MSTQLTTSMQGTGWRSSPTVALFQADFRRHWNDRTIRTSFKVLAAILVLQLVVGLLLERVLPPGPRAPWNRFYGIIDAVGLDASWTGTLLSSLNQLSPGRTIHTGMYPMWMAIIMSLLYVPLQMLVPAFAAQSVAPDRENGRLEELLLAGYTPRQLLLANGLAALAPFLLLWMALQLVNLGAQAYWVTQHTAPHGLRGSNPGALWTSFFFRLILSLLAVTRFAALVCVSALCRRLRMALVGCYLLAFLWPVLTQVIQIVWTSPTGSGALSRSMSLSLGGQIFMVAALAFLLPKALQAIADPNAEPRPAQRRMRIMDYGAEEPLVQSGSDAGESVSGPGELQGRGNARAHNI